MSRSAISSVMPIVAAIMPMRPAHAAIITPVSFSRSIRVYNSATQPSTNVTQFGPALGPWTDQLSADNNPTQPNYNASYPNMIVRASQTSDMTPTGITFSGIASTAFLTTAMFPIPGFGANSSCAATFTLTEVTDFGFVSSQTITGVSAVITQQQTLTLLDTGQVIYNYIQNRPIPAHGALAPGTYLLSLGWDVHSEGPGHVDGGFSPFSYAFTVPTPSVGVSLGALSLVCARRRRIVDRGGA